MGLPWVVVGRGSQRRGTQLRLEEGVSSQKNRQRNGQRKSPCKGPEAEGRGALTGV